MTSWISFQENVTIREKNIHSLHTDVSLSTKILIMALLGVFIEFSQVSSIISSSKPSMCLLDPHPKDWSFIITWNYLKNLTSSSLANNKFVSNLFTSEILVRVAAQELH